MRTSQLLLATLKETPADAEVISHQLMLRAGLIRQVAAGIYNWLPMGMRVLHKVQHIVRQEMDRSGAQEVLLPGVQPAGLWQESGRWEQYGPELLRLQDRHGREFCLGPTHEEIITTLVKNDVRSYRQLPLNFYQIQTKFRDGNSTAIRGYAWSGIYYERCVFIPHRSDIVAGNLRCHVSNIPHYF